MSANGTVQDSVREALRSGKLPGRPPERFWAGSGSGACCMACAQRISADELEYELEFAPDDDTKQLVYNIHIACFWIWESERQRQEVKRRTEKTIELSTDVAETRLAQDEWEISGNGGPA